MGQAESSNLAMSAAAVASGSGSTGGAVGIVPALAAGQPPKDQDNKKEGEADNAESKGDKYQRLVIELVSQFPDLPPWRLDAIAIKYSFEGNGDDGYEKEVAGLLDDDTKPEEVVPFVLHRRQPGVSKVDSHDPVEAGVARAENSYKLVNGEKT